MDRRQALPTGVQLAFPGMSCTIGKEIGRGSNAIVYQGYYLDHTSAQQHHVLIKELFPYAPDGAVRRGDDLIIHWDAAAQADFEVHRLSFEKGNEAHLRLLADDPQRIGANLNTFPLNGTLYTVLGMSGGCSLESVLDHNAAASLKTHVKRLLGLLNALRAFHEADCVHLDISPDNILLIGEDDHEQMMLIDFNSVHDLRELQNGSILYYSAKQGYTPPEVRTGRTSEISMASDLFSVAAVFYRMIAGMPLTDIQLLRKAPPDVDMHPCMQGMSNPVQAMVRQILKKGLTTVVRRRYQHISEMRIDLLELLDRIDGIGITHWALWETGKRTVSQLIRSNASMHYLRSRDSMYPLLCRDQESCTAPVQDVIARIMGGSPSALLTAPGGMGKTTALLNAVEQHTSAFSPATAAVVYVPLYGYRYERDGAQFIMNSILAGLHYRADTSTYADARQVLSHLLDKPLNVRGTERPMLLLLLDGLNEAEGDPAPLLHEIMALSRKAGVRLLVTSRSDVPELPLDRLSLCPLEEDDICTALSAHGLLLPESSEMQQLLATPMMLSMFIQASKAEEKQLQLHTADELLHTYLRALLDKEQRKLDEQSPERWQLEAAVQLILPALAQAMHESSAIPDDHALLEAVERCYRLLPTKRLRRLHPGWTGHHRDIRGNAKDAEEWYGMMVHALLWQRLGLLIRDDQCRYRINHQIMAEYLLRAYRNGMGRIEKQHRLRQAAAALLAMFLLTGTAAIYECFFRLQPYDEAQALKVFDFAVARYVSTSSLNRSLAGMTDAILANDQAEYSIQRQLWPTALAAADSTMLDAVIAPLAQALPQTGDVMPWSRQAFDMAWFSFMLEDHTGRITVYERFASALAYATEHQELCSSYLPEYPMLLQELLDIDAKILSSLYRLVCAPHLKGLENSAALEYSETLKTVGMVAPEDLYTASSSQESEEGLLQTLLSRRADAENRLNACGLMILYDRSLSDDKGGSS